MIVRIIGGIINERLRQDNLHPVFPEDKRLAILIEEVGEVATAIQNGDIENLKEELIQVASVCVRWLEHIIEVECNEQDDSSANHTKN
jgi:NTP pyrophosphatase (non-canonical NTP hydrolase)